MLCNQCKTKNFIDAKYCSECGAPLNKLVIKDQKKKRKAPLILIILILCVLVGFLTTYKHDIIEDDIDFEFKEKIISIDVVITSRVKIENFSYTIVFYNKDNKAVYTEVKEIDLVYKNQSYIHNYNLLLILLGNGLFDRCRISTISGTKNLIGYL